MRWAQLVQHRLPRYDPCVRVLRFAYHVMQLVMAARESAARQPRDQRARYRCRSHPLSDCQACLAVRDDKKVDVLVNINRQISEGLLEGQRASARASQQQSAAAAAPPPERQLESL